MFKCLFITLAIILSHKNTICNTYCNALSNAYFTNNMQYNNKQQGGFNMAFQLKPNKKETENKTIRFPMPLIERIESTIKNQDVTFSSFVIQACEYALDNMDISEDD